MEKNQLDSRKMAVTTKTPIAIAENGMIRYELDQKSRNLGRQEHITSTQASGGHNLPSAVRPQKVADTIARYGRQNKNDFPVLDQKGGSSYPRG